QWRQNGGVTSAGSGFGRQIDGGEWRSGHATVRSRDGVTVM
ncbi:hypothetical protein A2U01_0100017, partial [Trifolium medium]|nr:hypothetical protein [Trifolium medium]